MVEILKMLLGWFDHFVLFYFLLFNSIFLVLVLAGGAEVIRARRQVQPISLDEVFAYPLTPATSVVVPAFNEELTIIDSVHGMLNLRYPSHEVVVVDDGSTDRTFELLDEQFDLEPIEIAVDPAIRVMGPILGTYRSRVDNRLIVVRKVNIRTRSDAVNAGLAVASKTLVCMTDADSIFDPDALLLVARAYLRDPDRIVGIGGTIRAINGSSVTRGYLDDAKAPTTWTARIQVVEYLRSFLLGRVAWSRLQALIIVSGAFGVYRRELLSELGGLDPTALAEDAELVVRVHRHMRESDKDYTLAFLPDPVCWTEVPNSLGQLAKQRRRWSRGLAEVLWVHRDMMFNPKFGRIGLVALPYYLLFELLGAVIEFVGVGAVLLGFAFDVVNTRMAIVVAVVALLYAMVLSAVTILIEEFSYRRYTRPRDLLNVALAGFIEIVGFRQIHAFWRTHGLISALRRTEATWEKPDREGFGSPGPEPRTPATASAS